MGKFNEKIANYTTELSKWGISEVDDALLRAVAKACGPSIYLLDASMVSCTDAEELHRVRDNFCAKNLKVAAKSADKAIKTICSSYGAKRKLRVVFYYLLTLALEKEDELR